MGLWPQHLLIIQVDLVPLLSDHLLRLISLLQERLLGVDFRSRGVALAPVLPCSCLELLLGPALSLLNRSFAQLFLVLGNDVVFHDLVILDFLVEIQVLDFLLDGDV